MMTDEDRIAVVAYRMENARRTLDEVTFHIKQGFYNTAMNRMYYACFYAVSALLVNEGIETKTHAGVRQMLGMHFVRTGKFPIPLSNFIRIYLIIGKLGIMKILFILMKRPLRHYIPKH